MTSRSTSHRRAGFLLCAAIQFVVLTACAMVIYPGGAYYDPRSQHYDFFHNFLSDLGTTRTFSGATNYVSSALFLVALVSLGAAFVAFAGSWRSFAFARGRARSAGISSHVFGIGSGLAFIGVGVTPFNLELDLHNTFVIAAFSLLLGYVVCVTILLAQNQAGAGRVAANLAYLAVVGGYVALVLFGPTFATPRGHLIQVTGQKIVIYASMLHVIYLTLTVRRVLAEDVVSAGSPGGGDPSGNDTGRTVIR